MRNWYRLLAIAVLVGLAAPCFAAPTPAAPGKGDDPMTTARKVLDEVGDMTYQKQVKFRDGLKAVLAPYNLRFGLVKEGLFISTEDGLIARQLRQRVTVDCDGTPFATAAKQLAADTGANLVLDPRLKEKANAAVTLKLEDVPLEELG